MDTMSWRTVVPLYGPAEFAGYTEEDIAYLKERFGALPSVLEEFYRAAGRTEAFHHVQDTWLLPEHFRTWDWLRESEHLFLLNENQGVCRALILREDLSLPDPPVYSTEDDEHWALCAPSTSAFLAAALAYEASFTFPHSPEGFLWLNEEDMDLLPTRLTQLPLSLQNWLGEMEITLYQNAPDNLAAVTGDEESASMLYGAVCEESYRKLDAALEGIGEPM